ncbi:hypothetical protein VTO42DRAFT_4103 [Malbranchea cinnamomea]
MSTVNANVIDAAAFPGDLHPQPLDRGLLALPLNLIALIVSHLDDVADLARLCRTCRVLNYMALPQLYRDLTLTSYDKIRYRDDFPEGCGSASPFSMGLNAVVTRPGIAGLVRSFTLRGEWREDGLEEYARVGRVPDSSMMLNIAVRCAIDRMGALESFSWELNTKLLEPVYSGLAKLPRLTSLTIRFPSSRHPRPTIVIPPMPHLHSLKVTHIDPLCYPDDLSTLLAHSKKLRELRLHWSTRMREAQEPSVMLHQFFRKCVAMKSPMRLKKLAMQNFYALHDEDLEQAVVPDCLEDVTILNSPGISEMSTSFVEVSWPKGPKRAGSIKSARFDRVDKRGCEFLENMTSLERLYFVHPVRDASDLINSARPTPPSSTSLTPPSSDGTVANNGPPSAAAAAAAASSSSSSSSQNPIPPNLTAIAALRDPYIQMITTYHGARLRHLLLPSRWALPPSAIGRLVRACPNLEQLALAPEISAFETMSLLMPFLRKLRAVRLLIPTPILASSSPNPGSNQATPTANPTSASLSYTGPRGYVLPQGCGGDLSANQAAINTAKAIAEIVSLDDIFHTQALGIQLADKELYSNLKIIGLGWKAWELGDWYTIPASEAMAPILRPAPAENDVGINPMHHHPPHHHHPGQAPPPGPCGNMSNSMPGDAGDGRCWPYGSAPAPSPPSATASVSVLGKRKERGFDEQPLPNNVQPLPPPQMHHLQPARHPGSDQLPISQAPNTPYPAPPLQHSSPPLPPHFQPQSTCAPPPPASQPLSACVHPQPQPHQPPHAAQYQQHSHPLLPIDLSKLRTATGEPVSDQTKYEIMRCLHYNESNGITYGSLSNGLGGGTGIPEGMVLRRRVKRASWDVLKHWEIWALDSQEI